MGDHVDEEVNAYAVVVSVTQDSVTDVETGKVSPVLKLSVVDTAAMAVDAYLYGNLASVPVDAGDVVHLRRFAVIQRSGQLKLSSRIRSRVDTTPTGVEVTTLKAWMADRLAAAELAAQDLAGHSVAGGASGGSGAIPSHSVPEQVTGIVAEAAPAPAAAPVAISPPAPAVTPVAAVASSMFPPTFEPASKKARKSE